MSGPRGAILAVAWLLIAAVIAVGAAGLAAAMAHQPGTAARAELTYEGDAAAAPALSVAQTDLVQLAADLRRLGELGRGALVSLVANDTPTLDTTVAEGQLLAGAIEARSAQIHERLLLVPGSGPNEALTWSDETRARRDLALEATGSTAGLEGLWTRVAAGSLTATRVAALLTEHDKVAGVAAEFGRKARYTAGLRELTKADKLIADARALRDALANTVDVTTLTQWLDRNAEYDAALRHLFQSLVDSKGAVNSVVRKAFTDERRAHGFLPANTSGIVIILAEIGRGGLNQAVIRIEEARGLLEAAVDRLGAQPEVSDGSTSSPGPGGPATGSPGP